MNCRSAQQLISPLLDQQLTGEEMLAMRRHLGECAACAEEYRQVHEVRGLLRGLSAVAPDAPLETRIAGRVAARAGLSWAGASRRAWGYSAAERAARPQRGRRLAGGLALACVALLMLAAPFAPSTGDAARTDEAGRAGMMEADLSQWAGPQPSPAFSRMDGGLEAGRPLFDPARDAQAAWSVPQNQGGTRAQRQGEVTLSGWSAAPLDDEAVGGYAAGDAALADAGGH